MQNGEKLKKELLSMTLGELEDFVVMLGQPKFRAKQIYGWLQKGVDNFDGMGNIPKNLRELLEENSYIGAVKISKKFVSAIDETRKYLLELSDGNFIKSVLMKYEYGYTICVSSQVVCKMGCKFCASTLNR